MKDRSKSTKNHNVLPTTFTVDLPCDNFNKKLIINTTDYSDKLKIELSNKALKYYKSDDLLLAKKYIKQVIKLFPDSAQSYYILGVIYIDYGNFSKAELCINKAIDIKPDFAEAHLKLGNILALIGNRHKAISSFNKAIEINPKFAGAYLNLGCVHKDLGNLLEAKSLVHNAIKLKPDFVEALSTLGNIYRVLNLFDEAETYLQKAIQHKPDFAEAYCNLGAIYSDTDLIDKAIITTNKAIQIDPNLAMGYLNLGVLLIEKGELVEAERFVRKAIDKRPNFAIAYNNLGGILKDLGKLDQASSAIKKSIDITPDFARAYFNLSTLGFLDSDRYLTEYLFSKQILINKTKSELVDLYFARANFSHLQAKYFQSHIYYQLANKIKLLISPSNIKELESNAESLFRISSQLKIRKTEDKPMTKFIFIVGMPRSGSTLLESIISMNPIVYDLGEINIFEDSYNEYHNELDSSSDIYLEEIYLKNILKITKKFKVTTNKFLYNYLYTGIIASQIPNAKIIHCQRNPLDNILSIFTANFAKGNQYSSSLKDSAKAYMYHDESMTKYKLMYRSQIYDLNYENLVTDSSYQIRKLITWLGWEWNDFYLSPHLNNRAVSTASSAQVRSPINTKSIGKWKNYREMLKPAIDILKTNQKFINCIS